LRGTVGAMSRGTDAIVSSAPDRPAGEPSHSPLVTIGMPVRNGARHLEEAIASLLSQTESSFVLHVSDNCSDDATPEICARLAAQDPRIRYERQDRDLGAVGNFNHLLESARTPFFMWAAHDDWWAPEFLDETLGLLRGAPHAIGCAVGRKGLVPETGKSWQVTPPPGLSSHDPTTRARAALQPGGWHAIYGLYRRDALEIDDPVLHDVFYSDGLFVFRMSLRGMYTVSNRILQVFRAGGQRAKAVGPEAHLYSGDVNAASRLMWHFAGEARLSERQRALVRGSVLRMWFKLTRDRVAGANLERASRARRDGRYLQLAFILTKHLFLRPGDLLRQASRRLRSGSGA
jgi:glycosyltransferase involved in cell wall biosynthesis